MQIKYDNLTEKREFIMKKCTSIIIFFMLILTSVSVFAYGEVCGEVLNTDIKAYINEKPIKSYNIDGWTGIVAEDLRDYGFYVDWDESNRTLNIATSLINEVTATYQFEENKYQVGSHAAYVYSTDIKTFIAGNEIKAFNIGGQTVIYIDELQFYGDVIWNADKREISYTYCEPWRISLTPEITDYAEHDDVFSATDGITGISATFTKNEDGTFHIDGENLGHLSWISLSYMKSEGLNFGFSMVASHLFADDKFSQLCSDMSTIRYDDVRLHDNADIANNHMKIYINDIPVKIIEVTQGKGNNHQDYYFVLDANISKEDISKIVIDCKI